MATNGSPPDTLARLPWRWGCQDVSPECWQLTKTEMALGHVSCLTCNNHPVNLISEMAEAASGMPVRSAHTIMVINDHCACVVNSDHGDCATNPLWWS